MKEFNIIGLCYPGGCFMVDTSDKIEKILDLIYKKKYFVINRPGQYGKTTTMTLLELRLLKSDEFLEKDLRLLFIMFLKPILNGYGFCFKEVQTGAEKRLDIVIVFKNEKFIVELKLWKGDEAHRAGLAQLKSYMKAESVKEGYMLIINKNKNKDFKDWEDEGVFCVMM